MLHLAAAATRPQCASLLPELENALASLERAPLQNQHQLQAAAPSASASSAELLRALLQRAPPQQPPQQATAGDMRALLQTPGKSAHASASVASTPMKRSECDVGGGGGARGSAPATPIRSTVRRAKVGFHTRFGEFGVLDGQFTEPSGVAVCNATGNIFVADTNNHRIQMFDAEGAVRRHTWAIPIASKLS